MTSGNKEQRETGLEIAVIGMAGKFPGAGHIDAFWENLKNAKESIAFFSEEELEKMGVPIEMRNNPRYVRTKGGVLKGKEYFDAYFFDYTPLESELMDPQVRIFHECTWEVLERSGYNPEAHHQLIGLYGGASSSFHWEALSALSGKSEELGQFAASHLVDKDYLCTRISYNLNLTGPSFTVQTACSTSLLAIHLGCMGLLSGECDLALAGGITLTPGERKGYLYREGMIKSPDGHCRAFDAEAKGTVEGEGAGIVALKRYKEAAKDGDHILAVIKGSAINNDGKTKMGFTAPSITGQVKVIRAAYQMAEINPESITYIETHGTGTPLGDSVEVTALTEAFNTSKIRFCAIGSVKTNVGHLGAAAGVTGFIKTVLALHHKLIPPSLNFKIPNPKIDFENSPFYVNTELKEWKNDEYPLRAGVSSFGIGGTNVHVVLEETPQFVIGHSSLVIGENQGKNTAAYPVGRPYHLILLSAKTEIALKKMARNLAEHLEKNPGLNLAQVAYTLQVGRKAFDRRKIAVCANTDDTVNKLITISKSDEITKISSAERPLVFMFPGQGAQYVNMGLDLYKAEPVFRQEMDRCFEILKPLMGHDIKEILYPHSDCRVGSPCPPKDCIGDLGQGDHRGSPLQSDRINQTEIAQPLIFAFEYALAQLLMKWGITPMTMIGHSIGEYTAACLAGVFSLQDVLKLVVLRGKFMQSLPTGTMLSVELPENQLTPLLGPNISLAAVNSPSHCVVSGTHESMGKFFHQLKENGYKTRKLHTSHAYHSYMMDPILAEFEKPIKQIKLNEPKIPYISNITGKPITISEIENPGYWSDHLRKTVQFSKGIQSLSDKYDPLFIEVGPGNALSSFVRYHESKDKKTMFNLTRHPRETIPDDCYLLNKVGQIWQHGVNIDWQLFYTGEKKYRVPLPTYPFERLPYLIEVDPNQMVAGLKPPGASRDKKPEITDWFYIPSWKRSMIPLGINRINNERANKYCWLIFSDESELGSQLVKRLKYNHQEVFTVKPGAVFSRCSDREYIINPDHNDDYNAILLQLRKGKKIPERIIHLWGTAGYNNKDQELKYNDTVQTLGFYSLMYLAQAIGKQNYKRSIQIAVITSNMQWVTGQEELCPEKATIIGAVKVIPREYRNIHCCSIDIIPGQLNDPQYTGVVDQILIEFLTQFPDSIVAYRNHSRWVQVIGPVPLEKSQDMPSRLKKGGNYLITGGLGGIGYCIALHLAKSVQANLVLTGRSEFPGKNQWEHWLTTHGQEDKVSRNIRNVKELERLGVKILVCQADVTDRQRMQEVIVSAEKQLGPVNGVIHAAGLPDGGVIPLRTREKTEQILAPKLNGTLILNDLFKHNALDFFVICSSLSSIRGELGQLGYCAANNFQDAFAYYKTYEDGIFTLSINWDVWAEVGMGAAAVKQLVKNETIQETDSESFFKHAILNVEGIEVFNRAIEYGFPQIVVSCREITRIDESVDTPGASEPGEKLESKSPQKKLYPRPELSTPYATPNSKFGQQCADVLQRFFGFEKVGIHDNFLEFGVTSLEMIRINEQLKKELKQDIPLDVMFERPSIHALENYCSLEEGEDISDNTDKLEQKEALIQNTMSILRGEE